MPLELSPDIKSKMEIYRETMLLSPDYDKVQE